MPEQRGHALRKGRRSIPGQVYLLTTVSHQRDPIFCDFSAARTLINTLRYQADSGRVDSLAFVVIPDHLHWLIRLHDAVSLPAVVVSVKKRSARLLGDGAPFWQRGFHDRALRRDEDLRTAARYVVANPLRTGLVESLADYPHWDAAWPM